jgi:hypothetical protein
VEAAVNQPEPVRLVGLLYPALPPM